eukprot:CAMPEP_0115308846 /NCGR_PEP_ID=MMETSP0270-20121206/73923_1 /TAXON_ID=71861 /ORGANISM="Scrippsiella trochoidea, Strain CCMP3099" /LENGTH=124 /DNA_ID=CAMNT_0002727445 /DNA_START=20 /DNA_END=394 /DNA_ORIENTATION=+
MDWVIGSPIGAAPHPAPAAEATAGPENLTQQRQNWPAWRATWSSTSEVRRPLPSHADAADEDKAMLRTTCGRACGEGTNEGSTPKIPGLLGAEVCRGCKPAIQLSKPRVQQLPGKVIGEAGAEA